MLRRGIYLLIIMTMLVGVNNIENILTDGGEKLLTTFHEIEFEIVEAELNIWGEYSKRYISEKEIRELVIRVASELGLDSNIIERYEEKEFQKTCTIEKISKEAKTVIKLVKLIEEVENNGLKVENYLIVNISLKDKYDSILYYREKLRGIFYALDTEANYSLTITSKKKGKLEEYKSREVLNTILEKINGKIKDKYASGKIYSVYAYSAYIPQYIVSKGKKINVDLAITYNEEEDMTYLYVAIPVITIDY